MGLHLRYVATWTCNNCGKEAETTRNDGMYISKCDKPDGWEWFYRKAGPLGMSGDEYLFCKPECKEEKLYGK